jgi:hypothetical protein
MRATSPLNEWKRVPIITPFEGIYSSHVEIVFMDDIKYPGMILAPSEQKTQIMAWWSGFNLRSECAKMAG